MKETTYLTGAGVTDMQRVNQPSRNHQIIDEEYERKMISYYTIRELRSAWDLAYKHYILPAMFGQIESEDAVGRLDEIEHLLSRSIPTLYNTGDESVFEQIAKLRNLLSRSMNPSSIRQRKPFRIATRRIYEALDNMALRTVCPALLPRWWKQLTGSLKVKIEPEDQERLQGLASASLNGLSITLANKIQINKKIIDAFNTLNLPVWANRLQVEERRRKLAKQYHPDRSQEELERMKEINAAADIIINEYLNSDFII